MNPPGETRGPHEVPLPELIEALSDPAAYRYPVRGVEVRQTHISAVFLAGPFAFKVKKPVVLPFADFGTPERRKHFCEEEVRLNRRLAPEVYLGVVPVVQDEAGALQFEGPGPAVEWAVKMQRLPEDATLAARLKPGGGGVDPGLLLDLARRVAGFHARAAAGPEVSSAANFPAVARLARENFEAVEEAGQVGLVVSRAVLDRLRSLTEAALGRLQGLIKARAGRGVPRETHGDLRLSHVYRLPDRTPPGDLVVVDALEFNALLRYADPVSDAAFLVMDLAAKGRRDLARRFADAFLEASGDEEGRALLPFYTSYRAAVRAKVGGITAASAEVSEAERVAALASARSHWLLALGALEEPDHAPCLVLVGGLPGAGKSTLSAGLADLAGFEVIRTDVVRKELAGPVSPGGFGEGLYTRDRTAATYDACRERALAVLFEGGRVIVDASFREESHRRAFLDAAREWGMPCVLIVCRTDEETTRQRLAARAGRGDASDADFAVYHRARELWQPDSPETAPFTRTIDTTGGAPAALDAALEILHEFGLFPGRR